MGDKISASLALRRNVRNNEREHHTPPDHESRKKLAIQYLKAHASVVKETYKGHEKSRQPRSVCFMKAEEKAICICKSGPDGCGNKCTRCIGQETIAEMVK